MKYNDKIKILMPVVYPVGGIRSYIKYTFRKYDKSKFEITLISTEQEWLDIIKEDMKGYFMNTMVPTRKSDKKSLAMTIFKTLLNEKYDIIHSQGYTAGIITCMINMVFKVPHIVTLHHVFNADQYSDMIWKKYGFIRRKIIENILNQADYVQAVSNDAMNNVKENFPVFRGKNSKLIVIKNGINVESFLENKENCANLLIKEEGKITIGFLGRYMPEKGFEYIIDAVDILVYEKNITNFKVVTVGGFGGFIREYKKIIINKRLVDYFQFLDFIENVSGVLKQFDVLLLPSLGEACPLVPMEALICGIPVIAFNSIGLREVLSDTPAIMVETKNVQELANAIIGFMNNMQNYKATFIRFVPFAVRKYDVKDTSEKLRLIYNNILKNNKKMI
jgi:glycosyltransferase involved in cell wall biosynthesis